ncbi:tyrosine-type recombinase/integrase [Snodgrassella sp. ESL0253]|nr:tyrosine-type recombinase/integrase [Snodgrassella sp. ESL0253]
MKLNRSHTIPLSKQVLFILNIMKSISESRTHLNSSTTNMILKCMDFTDRLVAHGLRALAGTILNEQDFDYDFIEASSGHTNINTIRRTYNCATYLE